jgi:hypothetical protein
MIEVLRVLLGLFVVAHGLVTLGIWTAPVTEKAPFNPSHSWLLGDARTLAITLAVVAAITFVVAEADSSPIRTGGRSAGSRQARSPSC